MANADRRVNGSGSARSNIDGQAVACHEVDGSRWGQTLIHPDANTLKVHDGHARDNRNHECILIRFKHHNIQLMRKYDGISPTEQRHREVCSPVLDPRMAVRERGMR